MIGSVPFDQPGKRRFVDNDDRCFAPRRGPKGGIACTPHANEALACLIVPVKRVAPERALYALLVSMPTTVSSLDEINGCCTDHRVNAVGEALGSKQMDAYRLVRHESDYGEGYRVRKRPRLCENALIW